MRKIKILGILGTALAILAMTSVNASEETLGDYLIDKKLSFLIVNAGPDVLLTTFGWLPAANGCDSIISAGFDVAHVRNYAAETQEETNADCRE